MSKLQRTATFFSLVAELSHIFCCGIPMLVAVLSTIMQIGLGGSFLFLHDLLHNYEIPIFIGSGLMLLLGLGLHYLSFYLDCRSTGCEHADCTPKKFRVGRVFIFAATLFAVNLTFFLLAHYGQ